VERSSGSKMFLDCSPTGNQGCRGCGADDDDELGSLDDKLLKLPFSFHGVDYIAWDPAIHETYLTQEGKRNLSRVARALRSVPQERVVIKGFCGPPIGPKMIALATKRTKVVHEFLTARGCENSFEFDSIGFSTGDDKGPRVELMLASPLVEAPKVLEPIVPPVIEEVKEVKEAPIVPVVVPVKPYLTVSFLDAQAKPLVRTWNDKPLGITFTRDETPVLVTKVVKGSKADYLGICTGMKVTGVEFTGQDMTSVEDKSFAETNDLLTKGVGVLPHETDRPYLALTFYDQSSNELMLKTWYTRPLGFSCSSQAPIVVTKVEEGSRAWELAVTVGMEIRKVAHTDLPIAVQITSETHDYAMGLIETGMKALSPAA